MSDSLIANKIVPGDSLSKSNAIGNAHIHASAANRRMRMRRITGQPYSSIALGVDLGEIYIKLAFPC